MMVNKRWALGVGACVWLAVALPDRAQAQSLSACGDIRLEAQAQCEFIAPSLECEGECEPVTFQAACEASLAASCDGQCTGELSVDCQASCQAACEGSCDVEPGEFSCQGHCEASCSGECDAACAADADGAACQGRCMAACSAGCGGECTAVPPSASCEAKCEAGCEGSCEAQANLDCNIDCQAEGFATCEAELQGGCELACQGDEGALFCDGQYVDPRDDIEACIAALKAQLNIEVMGYAEARGECSGNRCSGEASAGVSSDCTVAAPGRPRTAAALPLLLLASLLLVGRRRVG